MDLYTIAWKDAGAEHVEGSFEDGDAAARAARERANTMQRPVRVVRQDGTTFMTIFPEAPTLVQVRRPRA